MFDDNNTACMLYNKMAALPILITTATVAYAIIFPNDRKRESKVVTPSSSSCPTTTTTTTTTNGGVVFTNNSFWIGVYCGMSISWLVSYEIKRRRLWDHARLKFLSWLDIFIYSDYYNTTNGDEVQVPQRIPLIEKYRKPVFISELKGTPIPRSRSYSDYGDDDNHVDNDDDVCGAILQLVSPDWALSSNLYCDILTIPPKTELIPKKTDGVEFYYVVKGEGIYNRNGEKYQISTGFGFIVDPECIRGFVVEGTTSNLVLLRTTDIALSDRKNDIIQLQANSMSSTVAIVRAGMNKVYQLIENISSPSSDQNQIIVTPSSCQQTNTTCDQ